MSRVAYDLELANIDELWKGGTKPSGASDCRPQPEVEDWLHRRFLHILKFFTFRASTPSSEVSRLLAAAFYGCSASPLKLFSSVGVRSASDIREPDPVFSQFLKHLPVLPDSVMRDGAITVRALQSQGLIPSITFRDVLSELREHPLSEQELVACLKWWINFPSGTSGVDMERIRTELFDAAVLCPTNGDGRVLPLSSVQFFINARNFGAHIPLDGPLPVNLIPPSVTKHFMPTQLNSFGWKELTMVDWLKHISRPDIMGDNPTYDFTKSSEWAERVLTILSRVWGSLSNDTHGPVKAVFSGRKCIPTTHGLQPPEAAYFPTVKIFGDLPIIQFSPGVQTRQMDKLLSVIGVRRHVQLQLVFDR